MSNRIEAARVHRRSLRLSSARDVPSEQSAIAAHMLGMIAIFASVIGLTYAAIKLWRPLS